MEPFWQLAEEFDLPIGIHMGPGPPGVAYDSAPVPFKSPNYRMAQGNPLLLEEVRRLLDTGAQARIDRRRQGLVEKQAAQREKQRNAVQKLWDRPQISEARLASEVWQAVKGEPAPPEWDRYRRAVRDGLRSADRVVAPSRFRWRDWVRRVWTEVADTG